MNILLRRLLICCAALVMVFLSAETASACSCAAPVTVDKNFDHYEVVGIFKVLAVDEREEKPKDADYTYTVFVTKFSVQKVFKGALKPGEDVTLEQPGMMCEMGFGKESVDSEFLLYLTSDPSKNKNWGVSRCSQSNDIKSAAADLRWLEKMEKVRGRTRLSGTVTRYFGAAAEGEKSRWEVMAASPLVVTGNGKTIRLKTDENGAYEVYDLAPGKYRVTPVSIHGYQANGQGYADVEIGAGALTEKNFIFSIDNAIRGRVLDSKGRALEDVTVELIPARGKRPADLFEEAVTERGGRFEFSSVPAGSYLIVVNGGGKVTASAPFGKFYYPGTASRGEASPVNIGPGQFIKNLIVTAPKTAETVTITGVVLYEDGKPAPKTIVNFYPDEKEEEESEREINDDEDRGEDGFLRVRLGADSPPMAVTDERGRFTIKLLKGQAGRLEAAQFIVPNEYVDCPKIDKLVRDIMDDLISKKPGVERTYSANIGTPPVRTDAEGDQTGVELRFPFPWCKKVK